MANPVSEKPSFIPPSTAYLDVAQNELFGRLITSLETCYSVGMTGPQFLNTFWNTKEQAESLKEYLIEKKVIADDHGTDLRLFLDSAIQNMESAIISIIDQDMFKGVDLSKP